MLHILGNPIKKKLKFNVMAEINNGEARFIEPPKPIGYLQHPAIHTTIAVFHPINWFQRWMIKLCFGFRYEKI